MSDQQHAPAAFYTRERPGTHFTGGWMGPRAGLEGWKISSPRDSIPDRPARSQSLYRLSYRPTFGTGFIVNRRIKHLVKDFKAKIPRICKIRVRGLFLTTVSPVHMHQQKKKMMMKRVFSMKICIRCIRCAQKETYK